MSDAEQVAQLIGRIRPILVGWPPQTQGAVLADLLATWLAGHRGTTITSTDELREELLQHHLKAVRALVPVNAAHIHGRAAP